MVIPKTMAKIFETNFVTLLKEQLTAPVTKLLAKPLSVQFSVTALVAATTVSCHFHFCFLVLMCSARLAC